MLEQKPMSDSAVNCAKTDFKYLYKYAEFLESKFPVGVIGELHDEFYEQMGDQ
jgi:hypothetical protein